MNDDPIQREVFRALAKNPVLPPALARSEQGRRIAQQHGRLVEGLREAVPDREGDAWMDSVLDQVDELHDVDELKGARRSVPTARRWTVGLATAAGLILTFALSGEQGPIAQMMPAVFVELVARPGTVRGDGVAFAPGDEVRLSAVGRTWLVVYFNDTRIVGRCGQEVSCDEDRGRSVLRLVLPAAGRYTVVTVQGSGPTVELRGALDSDVATLRGMGLVVTLQPPFLVR
ncbi:MAG: hypothetical protein JKY37_22610 [Nannocystaceae bacterium]|nr:hypothetical protein [Nannocystaceae bacterium]